MDRAFVKFIFLLLMIMILCSGCGQNNIIVFNNDDSAADSRSDNKAVKYRSGAVVLKAYANNNESYKQASPESRIIKVNFGPKDVDFDR
jgi:hypothetical protein